MLAGLRAHPFLRRRDLLLAEHVRPVAPAEQAALVDPAAEVGRHRHVRRGGDDVIGEFASRPAPSSFRICPKACWVDSFSPFGTGKLSGTSSAGASRRRGASVAERHLAEEDLQRLAVGVEPGKGVPFRPFGNPHASRKLFHLLRVHQAGVVVLVPGQRQAVALDRIGDETRAAGRRRTPRGRPPAPSPCHARRDWSSGRAATSSSWLSRSALSPAVPPRSRCRGGCARPRRP